MKPCAMIPITAAIDETFDPPFRRFWWLKRIALFVIAFVCFVIGSWFWLKHRAERQLAAEIQEWKKEGLPIETRDFEEPPLPDEENAAVALNNAVHAIVDMTAWDAASHGHGFQLYPWTPAKLAVADETTAINHKAFADLRSARRLSKARWDVIPLLQLISWNKDPHRVDLPAIRALANIIRTAAMAAHQRGDDSAVLEYLHDLQFIAEITSRDSSMVSSMVGVGIDSLAASMVGKIAGELRLDRPAIRAETKARMASWLVRGNFPNKQLYLAREGNLQLEFSEEIRSEILLARDKAVEARFEAARWRVLEPLRVQQSTKTLRYTRRIVHAADVQNWPEVSRVMSMIPQPMPARSGVEPLNSLSAMLPNYTAALDRYLKMSFRRELQIKVAATRLACRLYAIDHGDQNPTKLADLVPDYLPAVPVDPFDAKGRPLRLHSATTQPFIYSVQTGTDLVANGTWTPTLAQHEDSSGSIFVSFLNPHPRAATTQPTSHPAR